MNYGMFKYNNNYRHSKEYKYAGELGTDLEGGLKLDLNISPTATSTATGGSVNIDMSKKMDENKSNTIIVVASLVAVVGIMGAIFYLMNKNK